MALINLSNMVNIQFLVLFPLGAIGQISLTIQIFWPFSKMSLHQEYHGLKRNEIELFVVRWMDLECLIQNEVSQKEKNKYHMLTIYMESKKKMVLINLGAGQE